jgi:hypothetical protein
MPDRVSLTSDVQRNNSVVKVLCYVKWKDNRIHNTRRVSQYFQLPLALLQVFDMLS